MLGFPAVADRGARGIDPRGERGFGNNPAAPNGVDQLVFADNPIAISHQIEDQIEDLRLDRNEVVAAAKFAAIRVQDVVREKIYQTARSRMFHLAEQIELSPPPILKTILRKRQDRRKAKKAVLPHPCGDPIDPDRPKRRKSCKRTSHTETDKFADIATVQSIATSIETAPFGGGVVFTARF